MQKLQDSISDSAPLGIIVVVVFSLVVSAAHIAFALFAN